MLRVLYLITEEGYFLSHRLPLALALLTQGHEVAVACRISQDTEYLQTLGITIFPIPFVRGSLNPWQELKTLWAIFLAYRRWRPNIVHQVAFKPVLYGTLCARILKVPRIINAISGLGILSVDQGLKMHVLRKLILKALRWLMRSRHCHLIVQNREDADFLNQVISSPQITLIPGAGINTDLFTPTTQTIQKSTTQAIMVSRLLWSKGVGELVAAARELKDKGITVTLVGEPDLQNPDHVPPQQLQEWQAKGWITWLGRRQDVAQLYQQADIAVFPSYYGEGVPKTLLEAASCGKPIITTDHPGCRDVVTDGVHGLLIPPKNNKALVEALLKLHQNPALRETMGQKGRERALIDFAEDKIIKATLDLY